MHPFLKKLKTEKERLTRKRVAIDTIKVLVKEHLQDHILYALYNDKHYKDLIFYGGSCLRKIYDLNRMSEDLDFEIAKAPNLEKLGEFLHSYFETNRFEGTTFKVQKGKIISRVTMKYPILYDLELSAHRDENLHLKVEINDRLSGTYPVETTSRMIGRLSVMIKHYDIETIMACKMVATLERVYKKGKSDVNIKGRDFYDLVWFMQKGIKPNEKKLKDTNKEYSVSEAFNRLDRKVEKIKYRDLYTDLRLFFEDPVFIKGWCKNFHDLYSRFRSNYS